MDYCGASYSKACGYLVPTWTVEPNIQSIHKGRLLGYVWKITLFKLLCSYLNCICSYSLKDKHEPLYRKLLKTCSLKTCENSFRLLGMSYIFFKDIYQNSWICKTW